MPVLLPRRALLRGLGGLVTGLALGTACSPPSRASQRAATLAPDAATSPARDDARHDTPDAGADDATRSPRSRVALVKSADRALGIKTALALFGLPALASRRVFLKPNLNSADPTPGSTHEETLLALIHALRDAGAGPITLGDRSGMADTRQAMQRLGLFALAKKHDLDALVLDELKRQAWIHHKPPGSQWSQGFYLPRPFLEADYKVMTCCLKTHRFGGHFTMALKNSVGLAARTVPGLRHHFMHELHRSPLKRDLMAELNLAVRPDLIVLDGVEAFVAGGPDQGDRARADLILVADDPVALDALAVAMLRQLGTTPEVSRGPIAAQDQIARALALGLGRAHAQGIELLTPDQASADLGQALLAKLSP